MLFLQLHTCNIPIVNMFVEMLQVFYQKHHQLCNLLPIKHGNFSGLILCEWQLSKDFSDFTFMVHCIDNLCVGCNQDEYFMDSKITAKSMKLYH